MAKAGGRRWPLPLLLALCVVRFWLMPLPSSFWLDETASVFVARYGAQDPSLLIAAPQAWHSWYYPLIRWQASVFGYSEIATRWISVLAMALFLLLFARLAARLIRPEAAWFAVFACLALPGFNYQAANARPYALGMCVFGAALLLLIRWLDSGRWVPAFLFAAASASVLYIHLLFWPSWLVFVIYATARLMRSPLPYGRGSVSKTEPGPKGTPSGSRLLAARETPVSWRRAIGVFGLCGVLVVPVLWETLALLREAGAHVIAPAPSLLQFFRSLELTLIVACAGGAWLLARVRRGATTEKFSPSALVLFGAWWLCQPVLLFAFSWITGDGVFVPRYLQLALPGAALAATAAAAQFIPVASWNRFAIVMAFGALAFGGSWRPLWPRHHNSDWRAAASAVSQIERNSSMPVICPSPFVEARPPAWHPDYLLPGFLYAHLDVYPIQAKPYLFPFETSSQAESFAVMLARATLAPSHQFLIYGWEPQVHFWRDWFGRRPEFAGWRQRRLGPFADVDVVVFER